MLLYVARSLSGLNGADRAGVDVLASLVSNGHPVAVLSEDLRAPARLEAAEERGSLRWHPAPQRLTFPKQPGRGFARKLGRWAKWSVLDVPRRVALSRSAPTAALVNTFGSHELWRRAATGFAGKSALIVQESPRHFGGPFQARPLSWALEAMATYSHLIFVSDRCRAEWLKNPELKGKTTFYAPNCCDEEAVARVRAGDREAVRRRLGFPEGRFVVACVATIQHRKGQDLLVDALDDLVRIAPNLELYLVGNIIKGNRWVQGSADWADTLRQRVEASGHRERVHFCGPRTDALDYLYGADLMILPSRAEAMPVSILEAMALETPVLSTAVDGTPEIVEHGKTGMLFDPARPEGLVEAFRHLVAEPERRRAMAAAARKHYWAELSWQRLAERYRAAADALMA
jgi:glycosyltransferase involved in cell wall biosynthesis